MATARELQDRATLAAAHAQQAEHRAARARLSAATAALADLEQAEKAADLAEQRRKYEAQQRQRAELAQMDQFIARQRAQEASRVRQWRIDFQHRAPGMMAWEISRERPRLERAERDIAAERQAVAARED